MSFTRKLLGLLLLLPALFSCSESAGDWGEPALIFDDFNVSQVSYTPGGKLLFVGNNALYEANTDGSQATRLFSFEGIARASMNADRRVVFDNGEDIYIADEDGSNQMPLADDPDLFEFAVSFTPDGEITFTTIDDANQKFGIWRMNDDGSDRRQLQTSEKGIFRHPRTSPDGKRTSFFVTGDGKPYVNVMNADGSERKRITASDETSRQASWSPDGNELVYSSMIETFDLWIMNADGSGARQLTSLPGDEAKPVFSPDGKQIVFVCFGCERNDLSSLHSMLR